MTEIIVDGEAFREQVANVLRSCSINPTYLVEGSPRIDVEAQTLRVEMSLSLDPGELQKILGCIKELRVAPPEPGNSTV